MLADLRPEFVDYLWNNLDSARFQQWAPDAHSAFAWEKAPIAVGDLGAEPGATYHSTEIVAGQSHDVVVAYVEPSSATDPAVASGIMAADVTVDGAGPYRWTVAYELDGTTTRMSQQFEVPKGLDEAAWSAHLEAKMGRLPSFLGDWFEASFVGTELLTRGSSTITVDNATGTFDVVVEQHIRRLTPDMLDWWWDNIGDTYRYQRWHPTAHVSFEWITPPNNRKDLAYDVGAVQRVVEVIGGSSSLDIEWLDRDDVPVALTYDHYVYGSTLLTGTPFGGFLLHEYDLHPDGGIHMKSSFRLPTLAGMPFAEALADHCQQEMQFLQYFLPDLFEAEYAP